MKTEPCTSVASKPLVYSNPLDIIRKEHPRSPRGVASNYFEFFEDMLPLRPGRGVVLYCRSSGGEQDRRGTLKRQVRWSQAWLRRHNVSILEVVEDVASGWKDERVLFQYAVAEAKAYGAVLVAESTDRFLRSWKFDTKLAQDAWPTEFEFETLKQQAQGVTLATILHPDTDWRVVRSHQTKRGYRQRCVPGEKKQRRESIAARAIVLWLDWDLTWRELAIETSVSMSTVRGWVLRFCSGCAVF